MMPAPTLGWYVLLAVCAGLLPVPFLIARHAGKHIALPFSRHAGLPLFALATALTAGLWLLHPRYPVHSRWLLGSLCVAFTALMSSAISLWRFPPPSGTRQPDAIGGMDPLTALPGRGSILALLEQECSIASTSGAPLSALLIDLDRFRWVNDTYGYVVGDALLADVAGLLQEIAGPDVPLGRSGGEEFLLLLPNTSAFEAGQVAEQIRATVHDRRYDFPDHVLIFITLSIGVATTAASGNVHDGDVLDHAEQALFLAKRDGRNRVCHAAEYDERRLSGRSPYRLKAG